MFVSHISIQTICNIIPRTAMSSWITTCSFRHSQRVVQSWNPQVSRSPNGTPWCSFTRSPREGPVSILYLERSSLYSVSLRRTYSNPLSRAQLLQDIHLKPNIWSVSGSSKHNCTITTLDELSALSIQLSEAPGPSITMVSTIRSLYTWEVLQIIHWSSNYSKTILAGYLTSTFR